MPVGRGTRNWVLLALGAFVAVWPLAAPVSPLQDQMDWLLQAKILANPHLPTWQQNYEVTWRPVPNSLGVLLIGGLARWMSVFRAAALAYAGCLALFVVALVYLLRSDESDHPLAELLAPLYAANHFFLMGFYNFALGLALTWLALGFFRRHVTAMTPRRWLLLTLLSVAIYLSHFLAFAVYAAGVAFLGAWFWRRQARAYMPLAVSFAPSGAALLWYLHDRADELALHYVFHNPLYYVWYQVSPWAPASNYYPVTPTWAAWINVAINAAAILAVPVLIAYALARRRVLWRSPWAWLALLLIVLGLAAPTRLLESLRPGQRLIFAGLFLLIPALTGGRSSTRRYGVAVAAIAALLCWNAAWWFQAGHAVKQSLEALAKDVGGDARVLGLADSHFHFREARPYRVKLRDPFSYPTAVNALRYVPYYPVLLHGGYLRALFGTGLIRVREPRLLPDVNRLWHLDDAQMAGQYTHLAATGLKQNLDEIAAHAAPLFDTVHADEHLLLMKRKEGPAVTAP
jgi:hypothetical protein